MNARISLALAAVTLAGVSTVHAQEAPKARVTVMTFKSQEKGLGAKAANELRDKLQGKFNKRDLYVLPTADVENNLVSSGFSPSEPLSSNDERALANLLRADEFITGTINKGTDGLYKVEARMVLPRDVTLSQALPVATNKDMGDAMDAVSKSARDAMKQLDGEKSCVSKARGGDIAGAIAAARDGIKEYPAATLARLCIANVVYSEYQKATTHADSVAFADSVLAVTQTIVQNDSSSVAALRFNAELYKVTGDSAKSRGALVALIRADPNNAKLITQVVNELAGSGHAAEAVPLVKELLQRSPGDPQLLRTAFLVYLAANDWQSAVAAGPELIRSDTSAADSSYYTRMAAAYVQLNQPDSAIMQLQAGVQKFPNSSPLLLALASSLRKNNRADEAVAVLNKVVAVDPGNSQAMLLLADSYAKANQPDSVASLVQRAAAVPGADKHTLSLVALQQGNAMYRAANTSKSRDDFEAAIKMLQLSDSIEPSVDAKFLVGASAFAVAQNDFNAANAGKSCELANSAHDALVMAQTGVEAGAADERYKATADQLLGVIKQFLPASESQIKNFCK